MKADPETEAEILSVVAAYFDAYGSRDPDRYYAMHVQDDSVAVIGSGPGEVSFGQERLRSVVTEQLARLESMSVEMTRHAVSRVGDVAWLNGEGHGNIVATSGTWTPEVFRFTFVLVRDGGRWLVASFHGSVPDAHQAEGEHWPRRVEQLAAAVQHERPDLSPQAPPDGLVTLLFTDIEDSTLLNERLGDLRWIELLREHNAIVRDRIKARRGLEVKTIGDAFMASFSSARRAVLCAIDVQRAFAAYNLEHPDEQVRVRMGLHAGEPVREGGDFFGKSVVLASRVAGQARGGEILVSGLLHELVESAGDIQFGDVREAELKGLSGRQRLHPVVW